jgi:hypothetical protein
MDKLLEGLKDYIDERILFVTESPEWRSVAESDRLWEKFVEFVAAYLRAYGPRRAVLTGNDVALLHTSLDFLTQNAAPFDDEDRTRVKDLIDKLYNQWISVEVRLPPSDVRVLVWVGNVVPHEMISFLKDGEWQTAYIPSPVRIIYVKYWMPLPEQPLGWEECEGVPLPNEA